VVYIYRNNIRVIVLRGPKTLRVKPWSDISVRNDIVYIIVLIKKYHING